jgi:hypothetical protein
MFRLEALPRDLAGQPEPRPVVEEPREWRRKTAATTLLPWGVWYDRCWIRCLPLAMKSPNAILHEHLPLIAVAEAWLLDVLLADAAVAGHLVRLDDHVAAVAPEALEPLLARLRSLGHTPKVVAE